MVSLLKKLQYTLESDLQELFGQNKKVEKNPIKRLNHYIKEAEFQTEETGKLLKRQAQLKQQLEKELEETTNMVVKRSTQLGLAKESGETELIEFASQEVTAYQTRQLTLEVSVKEANDEWIRLERNFEKMKHQLKDMKIRQLQLMGKENVTRAQHKMNTVMESNHEANYNDLSHYIENLATKTDNRYEITQMEERLAQLERQKQTATSPQTIETKEETN